MADFTLTFNADTGFTYDSAVTEFAGGTVKLKLSAGTAEDTIITPDLDISGGDINRIELTYAEGVGYTHRVMVSFDEGATYQTFADSGWRAASLDDIGRLGITLHKLSQVREWGRSGEHDSLRFAIHIEREDNGGDGSLGNLDGFFGPVLLDFSADNPAPDEMTIAPNLGYRMEYSQLGSDFTSEAGYHTAKATQGPIRRTVEIEFKVTDQDIDAVIAFLNGHTQTHFEWTPLGYDDPLEWVCKEPEVRAETLNFWNVRTTFTEVYAFE